MDYNDFGKAIHEIVARGETPRIDCACGRSGWFYEGSIKYVYRDYVEPCPRCGSTTKVLTGDAHAEL